MTHGLHEALGLTLEMKLKIQHFQRLSALLRDALSHGNAAPYWRPLGWAPLALALMILCTVSFLMLWLGGKINSDGIALTRYMARGQATLSGLRAYPEQNRERIGVILFDQTFLDAQGTGWPMSYGLHADFLDKLVEQPEAVPAALFLDITFHQRRDASDVKLLKESLCRLHQQYGVRVYLAALPDSQSGRLTVRPELMAPVHGDRHDCYTLVGVDYRPDPVDGVAWTYELNRHFDGRQWVSGKQPKGNLPVAYKSAAQAIAEDSMGIDLSAAETPMALFWGATSATPLDTTEVQATSCKVLRPRWQMWLPDAFTVPWEEPSDLPPCAYHRNYSAQALLDMDEASRAQATGGKLLVLGAQIPGNNDFAQSPVHGLVPGPQMHAMALDNLLTYGVDYKRNLTWGIPMDVTLLATTLGLLSMVFFVNWLVKFVHYRYSRHFDDRLSRLTVPARLVLQVTAWAFKMLVIGGVVLLLVATLSNWLAFGLLPITELVGMAIVAEGLGYMAWLKHQLYPDPESAPNQNKTATKREKAA